MVWLGLLGLQAYRIDSAARRLQRDVSLVQEQFRAPEPGAELTAQLALVQADSRGLRRATATTLWHSGRWVPGLSGAVRETGATADSVQQVTTEVLPPFVALAADARHLRAADGSVDVRALTTDAGPVTRATSTLRTITAALATRPESGVLPVDRARGRLLSSLGALQNYAQDAAISLQVAPAILGAQRPTTILIVLESPAEARAGGGLVGGYVLLAADRGRVRIAAAGTNRALQIARKAPLSLGPQYDALYTPLEGRRNWLESNLSPDFPKTGALWEALFHAQYGITPDAELAVTPGVLDRLLSVTGPVTLPDGQRLDAGQVDQFLQVGLYAKYPTFAQEPVRNAYQLAFLNATIRQLLTTHVDPARLLTVLGPEVDSGGLRLHVAAADEQELIASTPLGGALPSTPGPFFAALVDNTDGTKLDAYLSKAVTYRRDPEVGGRQRVTAVVTMKNTAPTSGLPPYVDTRQDIPAGPHTADGSHRFLLAVYLATDATDPTVQLDGRPFAPLLVSREEDHLLVWLTPPSLPGGGTSETITVSATEPASRSHPLTLGQPSLSSP